MFLTCMYVLYLALFQASCGHGLGQTYSNRIRAGIHGVGKAERELDRVELRWTTGRAMKDREDKTIGRTK